MLVIFLFAFGFSHDMQTSRSSQDIRGALARSENMPGKQKYLKAGAACAAAVYCLQRYAQRRTAESIVVFSIFLLVLFIAVYYLWGARLQDMKKEISRYLRALPKVHMVRHRYQTTVRYVCLLTMVHVYFMFFFLMKVVSNVIAEEPEELFPYDYVLLANSGDEELIGELQRSCRGEVYTFPMVRATTIDNTKELDKPRTIILQQGQNIGISETTYRELKKLAKKSAKEDLQLDDEGKKIHIVYQQDQAGTAKPLDWYMLTKQPYLHIGQPLFAYDVDNYEKYYPLREIAGEERESLIGCFKQGKYENLVVFSDEYFEQVKDYWKETDMYTGETADAEIYEGPTRLTLISVPEKHREKADKLVARFRKIHEYDESLDPLVDSAYAKEEAVRRRQMEHILEILVNGFICVMLLIVSVLLLYIRTETELPEIKKRYQLMKQLGMRQKERIGLEKKETARFVMLPLALAVSVALIFTGIVFLLRDFGREDMMAYGIYGGGICLVYILIQLMVMKYLQYQTVRRTEGKVN